jgi:hypothetical protein
VDLEAGWQAGSDEEIGGLFAYHHLQQLLEIADDIE